MTPLEETLTNNVDRRLAAAQPTPDLNIYDDPYTDPNISPYFPFNAGCWAADFDFTCVSPYNYYRWDKMAGTLVTPRHVILAHHYVFGGGAILFVDRSGNLTVMAVDTTARVGTTDIQVMQLTEDVPEGITFASVLPSNWTDYITSSGAGLPAVYLNAARTAADKALYDSNPPASHSTYDGFNDDGYEHDSREARVADVVTLDSSGAVSTQESSDGDRAATYKALYAGDSGCPTFFFARPTEPILLFCASVAGSGPALHHYADDINDVIASFSNNGGYQLNVVDLSSFADILYWSSLRLQDWKVLTINQLGAMELQP